MSGSVKFINKKTKQVWEIENKDHILRLSQDPDFEEYVEKKEKKAPEKAPGKEAEKEPEKEAEKETEPEKEQKK